MPRPRGGDRRPAARPLVPDESALRVSGRHQPRAGRGGGHGLLRGPRYTTGWDSRTFQRLERARKKKYMSMRKREEAT